MLPVEFATVNTQSTWLVYALHLKLAIGLTEMEKPCCFPVIHSVAKDDEDNDVVDDTRVYNLRVYFIEAFCMSCLLLLYVLSGIAHAPSWSK